MATWPVSPSWVDPSTINSGNEYTSADGVTYDDMNTVIEDLINLKNSGTLPTGSVTITSNGTHNVAQYASAVVAVPTSANLQEKAVTPTQEEQVIYADSGYDGLLDVTISPVTASIDENIVAGNIKKNVSILGVTGTYEGGGTPTLQSKTATPSTVQQVIEPDSGYDGLSSVTVRAANLTTTTITANGTYTPSGSAIGFDEVFVDVSGGGTLQEKSVSITSTSVVEVTPDSGYDGMSKVTISTNIPDWDGSIT